MNSIRASKEQRVGLFNPRREVAGAQLRMELLGGFQLWRDRGSEAVPLSVQRLLAFLALQWHGVSRRHVAGAIWPDATEEQAGANLRSALWRSGRSGVLLVETTRTHIGLATSIAVDVREMLSVAERLTDPTSGYDPLDMDLMHLIGDLLPGWYEDWVVMERERLRQIRLHALEVLCRHLLSVQVFDRAVQAGLAAVTGEPLRESANRTLIEAFLAEGNVADAILQYRRYRDMLLEELGVRPSFRLAELVHGLNSE